MTKVTKKPVKEVNVHAPRKAPAKTKVTVKKSEAPSPAKEVIVEEEQGFFASMTDMQSTTRLSASVTVKPLAKKIIVGSALVGAGIAIAKLI